MCKSKSLFGCIVLLISAVLSLTGCSAIGYGIGSALDPVQTRRIALVPDQLNSLPTDTKLIVLKNDSTVIQGTFVAVSQIADSILAAQYRTEFERWRIESSKDSNRVPPFGNNVMVLVSNRHEEQAFIGQFWGFDQGVPFA